mgnify:CR=1 FL=1
MSWEIDFLNAVQHLLRNEFLDVIMPFISALGNAGIFWILLTLVLLIIPKTRKTGLASAIALLIMLVTGNMIMKPLVARLRPFTVNTAIELLIPPPLDFSFPSGHTFASFASAICHYEKQQAFWHTGSDPGGLYRFLPPLSVCTLSHGCIFRPYLWRPCRSCRLFPGQQAGAQAAYFLTDSGRRISVAL